jgi:3-oxoadipate enol-lactonase / 4-carboxymuconolactone decarboxylase
MSWTTLQGINIHYAYLDRQNPRTFVFINSLGTDFRIWDAVVEKLKDHGNILRFDKPGHGLSGLPDTPFQIKDYAALTLELMDSLNIRKAVIVGLSIGGVIGQYLGIYHPERIEKLILSNTAPKIGSTETWNTRIEKVRAEGISSIADTVMKVWFSASFHQERQAELMGYRNMLANSPLEGYLMACAAIRDNDLSAEISKIQLPCLCIGGSVDGSTPPLLVESMAQAIPNAQFVLIDDVGHIPCVEAPNYVVHEILDFVVYADTKSLYQKGMITRRAVLGDAHVDRAEANKTEFDRVFQEYITNNAWGAIWSRPGLSKRERSMLTIAVLATLGQEEELAMHLRATVNTGTTLEDIKETFLHIAVYAGVPVSNTAFRVAKKVFENQL